MTNINLEKKIKELQELNKAMRGLIKLNETLARKSKQNHDREMKLLSEDKAKK